MQKILIINNGTKHLGQLIDILAGNHLKVIHYSRLNNIRFQYDLIILTGGGLFPVSTKHQIYRNEIKIIKNTSKPVIGICYGFQLITDIFGGKIFELKQHIRGNVKLNITTQNSYLFKNVTKYPFVYASHHYSVLSTSSRLDVLACSSYGIEIIKHKTRPIVGFQFHPEITTGNNSGKTIMLNAIESLSYGQNPY